jgi:hypothetical protein
VYSRSQAKHRGVGADFGRTASSSRSILRARFSIFMSYPHEKAPALGQGDDFGISEFKILGAWMPPLPDATRVE